MTRSSLTMTAAAPRPRFDDATHAPPVPADEEAPAEDDDPPAGFWLAGSLGGAGLVAAALGGAGGGAGPGAGLRPGFGTGAPQAATDAVLGLQMFAGKARADGSLLTNDGTVLVRGLVADGTWKFSFDDGQSWNAGSGDRIPGTAGGSDGGKEVLVYQTDPAGQDSGIARLRFELDKTPPARPTLRLLNDTGPSATDHVTSDGTLVVENLDSSATLEIRIGTGAWTTWIGDRIPASALEPAGGWSVGLQPVKVSARQVDEAGNIGSQQIMQFTLYPAPPATPDLVLAGTPAAGAVMPG